MNYIDVVYEASRAKVRDGIGRRLQKLELRSWLSADHETTSRLESVVHEVAVEFAPGHKVRSFSNAWS
jgi:hypothetical protein